MKTVQVTCDGCGKDLTTRSNCVDYRLALTSESKPGYGGGAYTAMALYPAIDHAHHFCDIKCLDYWRDRERHYNELWRVQWDKWKNENVTGRMEDGRIFSYRDMTSEERAKYVEEFKTVALAEFPMKNVITSPPAPAP